VRSGIVSYANGKFYIVYTRQIFSISSFTQLDILFRNVCLEALKIDGEKVVFTDFSFAVPLHPGEKLSEIVGPYQYRSNEMLTGMEYDHRSDLGMLGFMLVFMTSHLSDVQFIRLRFELRSNPSEFITYLVSRRS
jgi:serine/threonine protein kinase